MSNDEELRDIYLDMKPKLDKIVEDLKKLLEKWCGELKIYSPRIEGRTKECHSLLNKVLERKVAGTPYGDDPLAELSDKVGVRADVIYDSDIDKLVARIRNSANFFEKITDSSIDDKRFSHSANEVGYSGVHIDVVPLERHGLARKHATCEIQIRTNAQAAWAMASHELAYKPVVKRTEGEKRRVFRLTALLELFDEQILQSRDELMSDPDYPVSKLIQALRDARFKFRGGEYNLALTQDLVSKIVEVQDWEIIDQIVEKISNFSREHEEKLNNVLRKEYPALLAQPEAILIFMMLEDDIFKFQAQWVEAGLPNGVLEKMTNAWGERLPPPI